MSGDGAVAGSAATPTLRTERALLRSGSCPVVVGMDEVGRGALAGPVTVGAVAVRLDTPTGPRGLRDSKLLTPDQRERLAPRVRRWAPAWGIGHAGNDEIDRWGILCALRVAGMRALADLAGRLASVGPGDGAAGAVILDGSYDWLRRPPLPGGVPPVAPWPPAVHLVVRADRRCAAVAAASVIAKVDRDARMVALGREDDRYGWVGNKGYAAPEHRAALDRHGPSRWHRCSWNILGPGRAPAALAGQDVLMPDLVGAAGLVAEGARP
ncbi:MAG: ribonuclease HII [Kineosporiaceae bacterium]